MRLLCLAAAFVVVSCNAGKRHEPKPASPSQDWRVGALLARELDVTNELAAASDPDTGWPSAVDCDALLWAGLAAAAGMPVNLAAAEYSPGEMHRRPRPACWTPDGGDQGSKSSVSRDMLSGYLWGVWGRGDLGAAQRLAAYGEAHAWVMGGGDPGRIGMGTNLKGLLARIIERLGGAASEHRLLPTAYLPGAKDYEQHLAVLGLLLEGEVRGGLYDGELNVLRAITEGAADDALFQAARGSYDGDMGRALDLLLDEAYVLPGYVRGAPAYGYVHWLFAADIVLRRY
jgi:hypothetical protein